MHQQRHSIALHALTPTLCTPLEHDSLGSEEMALVTTLQSAPTTGQQDPPAGSITISFLKAHWHQLGQRPDLVLGLNAGKMSCPADHPRLAAEDDSNASLSTFCTGLYACL